MDSAKARDFQPQRERQRERLSHLGSKAQQNPSALSLKELDEICTLAAKLCPSTMPSRGPSLSAQIDVAEAFKPLKPEPHLKAELQALLRIAHAAEYIASHLADCPKAQGEGT